jgi:hypothetical protein
LEPWQLPRLFAIRLWFTPPNLRCCNLPIGRIRTASSLQKLTATAPGVLEEFESAPARLQAARGEWESFQIVVTAGKEPLSDVTVSTNDFKISKGAGIPATQVQLFRENYVFIDKPSGNRRLEKLWWPDALIPLHLQPKVDVAARRSVVFWVRCKFRAMPCPASTRDNLFSQPVQAARRYPPN